MDPRIRPSRYPRAVVLDEVRRIRAILVGVAGNVSITTMDDRTVTLPFAAGVWHPQEAKAVLTSGTTATGIFVEPHSG